MDWQNGELGIFTGGTGLGKSFCLTCLSSAALSSGKRVVYYTLELSAREVGLRHDSKLTGIPLDFLIEKKDLVFKKLSELGLGKNLTIKEYPTKMASIETIRSHLNKLQETERQGRSNRYWLSWFIKATLYKKRKVGSTWGCLRTGKRVSKRK